MKIQVYFSLHICLLLCITVNSNKDISDEYIYRNMHMQQKFCGSVLANTMRELCVEYNGLRARRSIREECCKKSCTFYHLMKYFCKVSRVQIHELPSSLAPPIDSETERPTVPQSSEYNSQSSENNGNRQERLPNKIQKQSTNEALRDKPTYGYVNVNSTRPPIIFAHSNIIARGVMNYQIPNQSNNSQQ